MKEVILLVGPPGSGKSTHAKNYPHHIVISQDEFKGSKSKFLERYNALLQLNDSIVIDRCNINKSQRKLLIDIAKARGVKHIKCDVFQVPKDECYRRVRSRVNHQTIPESTSDTKIKSIVESFFNSYEPPKTEEGFESITLVEHITDATASSSSPN